MPSSVASAVPRVSTAGTGPIASGGSASVPVTASTTRPSRMPWMAVTTTRVAAAMPSGNPSRAARETSGRVPPSYGITPSMAASRPGTWALAAGRRRIADTSCSRRAYSCPATSSPTRASGAAAWAGPGASSGRAPGRVAGTAAGRRRKPANAASSNARISGSRPPPVAPRLVTWSTSTPTGAAPATTSSRDCAVAAACVRPSRTASDTTGSTMPRRLARPTRAAGAFGTRVQAGTRATSATWKAGTDSASPPALKPR